jgi:ubiquinone/menaquinone biosynthesis C-methylase UbiE
MTTRPPGLRALKIAFKIAGEGFYSLRIARVVAPTGRVMAVDVTEKYLETARRRYS